jgi:hypothetical protein
VGAVAEWISYSMSIGALADQHGAVYRRERRVWVIGGAALGAWCAAFVPARSRFC